MPPDTRQFYIGNPEDYDTYKTSKYVGDLPVKNLPMSYFPFFYNNSESSISKLQRLVPLIENYTKTPGVDETYTIDTEELFKLLSLLEDPNQPFNTNNAQNITLMVLLIWFAIGMWILKVVSVYFENRYVFVIIFFIGILLVFGVIWTLFVTNTVI